MEYFKYQKDNGGFKLKYVSRETLQVVIENYNGAIPLEQLCALVGATDWSLNNRVIKEVLARAERGSTDIIEITRKHEIIYVKIKFVDMERLLIEVLSTDYQVIPVAPYKTNYYDSIMEYSKEKVLKVGNEFLTEDFFLWLDKAKFEYCLDDILLVFAMTDDLETGVIKLISNDTVYLLQIKLRLVDYIEGVYTITICYVKERERKEGENLCF